MDRRRFLQSCATLPLAASAAAAPLKIKKAVLFGMLPDKLSIQDRFRLAADAGFSEMECPTTPDQKRAEEMKKAADSTRLRIHSVMNQAHWKFPLSSADPGVVKQSMDGMETSLRNAHFWGSDTVLLVPAVVNPQTGYQDAWTRSQAQIRKLIPLAKELKVVIAVEEVWNKFLVSPLEFARYVDEFKSPWVQAYFDVGNVLLWAYPQDWIRVLGKRIVKLHFKDFTFKDRIAKFVNLREGDIDWPAVHKALAEVGFSGTATVELAGGDEAYLKDVSRRFDLILSGV
ncbi:MAG: sugar phosphate isomerase/epimerase family protein [Bryobacteraceae bacterium]